MGEAEEFSIRREISTGSVTNNKNGNDKINGHYEGGSVVNNTIQLHKSTKIKFLMR